MKRRTESEELDSSALAQIVIPQLRAGIASIDTKQPETVIGKSLSRREGFSPLDMSDLYSIYGVAQAVGHEMWQAVWDMVKNVSEIMLSSLPQFWKIAKSYMNGKHKKVCL